MQRYDFLNRENIFSQPPQKQKIQPGSEQVMSPKPQSEDYDYKGSGKLKNKVAIITGGDSGIGKAIAILFAKEGADVVINYLFEHEDAHETQKKIEDLGRRCIALPCDISDEKCAKALVDKAMENFNHIDIVINNAAEQFPQSHFENITAEQLDKTFKTNIYSYFFLTRAALPYLKSGDSIINTTSVVAYKGSPELIDYSATKGAIVAFTRSLSQSLVKKGIRVNGVAPGPIWTPLIPASFSEEKVEHFGEQVPMGHSGQPYEIAPCYLFLACKDSIYMTGQVLHPNGGVIVNG